MIKDLLCNYKNYRELDKNLVKGLEFLSNTDWELINDGKHIISDEIYVNIQTYVTKDDADFEAHREYIDIQYILSGEELIGVTDYKKCETTIPYDKEKDIEFLSGEGFYENLSKGEFMILYPNDSHKPSISIDKNSPQKVRKAVVKVKK